MTTTVRWQALIFGAGLLLGIREPLSAQSAKPAVPVKELTATELFAKNASAIVTVTNDSGLGSGVILSADGLVVTNLHVIVDEPAAAVKLPNGDVFDHVVVVAVDQRRDLALLRIAGFGLPTVPLGDSDGLVIGQHVYAIGAPKGFERSLSDGLVAGIRNTEDGYRLLQTTAAISPGSSGGGLFNARGELIGITSMKIQQGENLNFALPVNYVRGLIALAAEPMSLADVKEKYGEKESEEAAPSTSPKETERAIPTAVDAAPAIPKLLAFYVSQATGNVLKVSQSPAAVIVELLDGNWQNMGRGLLKWDSTRKVFAGAAEVRWICGKSNSRTIVLSSTIEYELIPGGLLRQRLGQPVNLNCSRSQVDSWQWAQDTFWPE